MRLLRDRDHLGGGPADDKSEIYLNKFHFYSALTQKYQDSRKVEGDSEDGVVTPQSSSIKSRIHFSTLNVPYSVPKACVVPSNLDGLPITLETAVALRKVLFGTAFQVFNYEWKKSHFKFRDPYSDLAYALEAERGGARSIQMAVQAYVIKYLLFTRNSDVECNNIKRLLRASAKEQENALAAALSDILWTAGEGVKSVVCSVTTDCYFAPTIDYKSDSYTERLQLFTFTDKGKLQDFITEYILCLSLGNFICKQALINLMLTGRASPNVFNGDLQYDDQGAQLKEPRRGVLARSDVGYLYWNRHELEHDKLPRVGSMLKTPKLPIWLCNISDTFSVLFNTNRLLLSDWKMEHLFDLYFYNGQLSQTKTVRLTIDTHSHHWEEGMHEKGGDSEKRFPSVEMTVRTKWEGAAIDWNGTVPFF
ncbi:hypothetical protein scyTo_0016307 [Scyliorhinus torazame]|uniref:Ubiquitin carboxyl-terminal hydrolase MINDY n=1 Tax=Scyliorhinus torazame TaxID=75743 RepID=A0A401Q5J9_SCYTO|nr:hypothetical protein [Scyliorhinus torazame]